MTTNPNNPKPSPTYFRASNAPPSEPVRKPLQHPGFGSAPQASFGVDAILPAHPYRYRTGRDNDWSAVLAEWLTLIAREQIVDTEVPYYRTACDHTPYELHLRNTDGALVRQPGKTPLAFQPGAWSQLISLLGHGKGPRGGASAFAWLWPTERARVFAELRDRSTRPEGVKHAMLFRTHIDPTTGLRALRAVVSARHSGEHFDDAALAAALNERVQPDAPAGVVRGIEETNGWAALRESFAEARASVHWRNSETGGAQLSFHAGCYISVLDVTVRRSLANGDEVLEQRHALLATEQGGTRRNHTLPKKNVTEERRGAIARERMLGDFDKAADHARALAASWQEARESFPRDFAGVPAHDRAAAAAVIMDAIEEQGSVRLLDDDRARVQGIIESEERLDSLPFGSAAYVAAVYACAARDAGDPEQTQRLQHLATEWMLKGWKR